MEDALDIGEDLVGGDVWMLPRVEDPRRYVLKNAGCDFSCGLVQYVGEVVLGQERMRGIRAVRVRPRLVLVVPARVDDGGATGFQLDRDGVDDGADK